MQIKYLCCCLCLFACVTLLRTQDPHFSQFYASRIYLNPAYTGLEKDWSFVVNYRDQWYGIPDGNINTFSSSLRTVHASAELQIPCFAGNKAQDVGLGFTLFHDQAGSAPLKTTGFGGAFSYKRSLYKKQNNRKRKKRSNRDLNGEENLDREKRNDSDQPREKKKKREKHRWEVTRLDLRIGAQASVMFKELSGDYFLYSEQLDPVVAPGPGSFANVGFRNDGFFNLNAGVMLRGAIEKRVDPILFTIGMSFSNLNQPDQSIESILGEDRLPLRYTLHFGITNRLSSGTRSKAPVDIAPQFRWDSQLNGRLNTQTAGFYVLSKAFYSGAFLQYNFPKSNNDPTVSGNFLTKNTTTLILNCGVDILTLTGKNNHWQKKPSGFVIGLSYDINLAGLNSTNSLGAMELSLSWRFARRNKRTTCGGLGSGELYNGDCPIPTKF